MKTKWNKKNKESLAILTDLKIANTVLKNKKNKIARSAGNKHNTWTLEEYQFMRDNWGKLSRKEIAEKLGRSLNAINCKAFRIGLKYYFVYSEKITLNNLHIRLYGKSLNTFTLQVWDRYNMPYDKTMISKELAYKTIDIPKFFKWFKKHIHIIDLKNCKPGCLGKEPKWFQIKRIADLKQAKFINKPWSKKEDKLLTDLVNEQKLGYRDICLKLHRTGGALKRRMNDKNLKLRPPRAGTHMMWSEKEIKLVKKLWLLGYRPSAMMEYINRSDIAINGLIERNNYFGVKPLKFRI